MKTKKHKTDLPFKPKDHRGHDGNRNSSTAGYYVKSIKSQLSKRMFMGQILAIFSALGILIGLLWIID
jgi:hypothetical protein